MKMPDSFAARACDEAFDAFRLGIAGNQLDSLLDSEARSVAQDAHVDELNWWAVEVGQAFGKYLRIGLEVFDHIEARRAAEAA